MSLDDVPVDELRLGRTLRALRHRLAWRQADLGAKAGVSQDLISLAERGRLGRFQLATIHNIAAALDADVTLTIRWRGGDLDRLLDEAHASLVSRAAQVLEGMGWVVQPEVTFAVFADRGAIDLLGWRATTRVLVVVEIKTELTSVEETLRTHDMKVRVAARVAGERFGWQPRTVARLLVLPDNSTSRRRVARHDGLLRRAYPWFGSAARDWLREPSTPAGLLIFLPITTHGRGRCGPVSRKRVRRASARSE
ncbi:MAG: helix-turn-helix transcriptional regulator [Gemmatimonadales bacterium]